MPLDYRRLVDGLSHVATLVDDGTAAFAAIDVLVATTREAAGAAGATYTDYGPEGGRVVVARGDMAWALGQPIDPEYLDPPGAAQPWAGPVDALPVEIAEPLLSRGVVALAGCPVRTGPHQLGAIHLFFGELEPSMWSEAQGALRVVAATAAQILAAGGRTPRLDKSDEDDRSLFLAVAGHELRTPVTVVKGYASMLFDRWEALDDDDRRSAARVLSQRADELARLVDRLLGATVGDGSVGHLVRTMPFDPLETLLRVARQLPSELRRSVRVELPNSLPAASGDPAALSSVVTELVTNAVRASREHPTREGREQQGREQPGREQQGREQQGREQHGRAESEQSTVELHAGADAHTVFIRVCDRGEGIDAASAERAFERFWRARRGGESGGGVGLGLYLVRRLVERQNGWVSLRPREGGGAIAEVRLPRADGQLRLRSGEAWTRVDGGA